MASESCRTRAFRALPAGIVARGDKPALEYPPTTLVRRRSAIYTARPFKRGSRPLKEFFVKPATAQLSPLARLKCHFFGQVVDFGFVREFWFQNFHQISPHAFRSAQPSPRHLAKWLPRFGIRTVVNLRGDRAPAAVLELESETCRRHGVALEHFKLLSRDMPTPERLAEARALLQTIEYPALFHCTSGADRAGLMSTLYLHWMENVPLERTRQLRFFPYRHIRYAKTGLLDHFFESYLAYNRIHPMDLMSWATTVYDPENLKRQFMSQKFYDVIVNRILRRE